MDWSRPPPDKLLLIRHRHCPLDAGPQIINLFSRHHGGPFLSPPMIDCDAILSYDARPPQTPALNAVTRRSTTVLPDCRCCGQEWQTRHVVCPSALHVGQAHWRREDRGSESTGT